MAAEPTTTATGPLAGLRVVDLTDDSGRFATKLLAEAGASVVRIGRGSGGPAMEGVHDGVLDWWYDGGKHRVEVDLDTDDGVERYRRLAAGADLIVETEPPGRLAGLGVDHADLREASPALVQVSLTPFGRTGPRRDWRASDLVAAALSGVLSLSGLPDRPVSPWGRQAFNVAGFYAAISGLAALRSARLTGRGQLVDVSIQETVATTIEQLLFQYWFDDLLPYPKVAERQGSLHWIRAYQVVPAGEGHLLVTPTPNFGGLMAWMIEQQIPEALELATKPPAELGLHLPLAIQGMAALASTGTAAEIFWSAQERHIAFGEVQSVAQVAANPQHEHRGFFRAVPSGGPEGREVRLPGPLARFHSTPCPSPVAPGEITSVDSVLRAWGQAADPARAAEAGSGEPTGSSKPLDGIRVLDLSHVLAGPMATRVLGDLGADVVKVQTAERATSVSDPNHPFFYVWNRSRRGVSLNMRHPRAVQIVRGLVEKSDVLIENFSAGVLDRWGLSYEQCREWNPGLVYVSMSGCGHDGPWSKLVTYAPTIHALCGLTHLSNPPERRDVGPGFSLNDHAAGLAAAFSILAALQAREGTGEGQHVDISQMETGGYLIGPALVDFLNNGREAQPDGNRDPFGHIVPNECYPTSDGQWLAVSARDDDEWRRLVETTGVAADDGLTTAAGRLALIDRVDSIVGAWVSTVSAEEGQSLLQAAGIPAGRIQNAGDLMTDPQLVERGLWGTFQHDVFGERPRDRYPTLFESTTLEPYLPSPAYVGEHNFEVYGELLGLDETAVAEGMAEGLFG